ncbi:MAG: glycoside hydrolase family 97 protein [Bacteroidota bacterium]
MRRFAILLLVALGGLSACSDSGPSTPDIPEFLEARSPSDKLAVRFYLSSEGRPTYRVAYYGIIDIQPSHLGFDLKDAPPLEKGFAITGFENRSFDATWELPWGEQREVRNHYNELFVALQEQEAPHRRLDLRFRAYDDGIGFRYEFPEQENLDEVVIMDENTEFRFQYDYECWWIPGDWDIYEHLYQHTKFSEIDALNLEEKQELAQSYIPENAVNTPFTLKQAGKTHLSFHEAALTDYAGMTLRIEPDSLRMVTELVGSAAGHKVRRKVPFSTPWRTIQFASDAAGLIESNLILNLNEPSKIDDMSWFQPMKYVGIWWEMHLGKSSWDRASGRHGATTENAKRHIDFAAENGMGGVLIEGWNTGWEHWIGFEDREGVFDFVTPYPDYDLDEVAAYAKEKGVDIIMHHETSAAPRTYEQQMDTAFALMKKHGMRAVKTGYVGKIIPKGEYHHGQWMVNHYRKVLEKAAAQQIAINAHEPIKDTGIRRTWPNAVSREGARGQEFNAWGAANGNPPNHLPILAFTRLLSGPMDFTPGIFNLKLEPWKENNQINTTLAQQLALYVVIYSPVQMAADLIEHYADQPAFQFIRDVGVDWEQSRVLNAEVGEYVTIAREERGTGRWFVGGITNEKPRELLLRFDFLPPGQRYTCTLYQDGPDAHWNDNPFDLEIVPAFELRADHAALALKLAPGGGFALSLLPVAE